MYIEIITNINIAKFYNLIFTSYPIKSLEFSYKYVHHCERLSGNKIKWRKATKTRLVSASWNNFALSKLFFQRKDSAPLPRAWAMNTTAKNGGKIDDETRIDIIVAQLKQHVNKFLAAKYPNAFFLSVWMAVCWSGCLFVWGPVCLSFCISVCPKFSVYLLTFEL